MSLNGEDSKKSNNNLGIPRNFLIPLTLLHLRELNGHGYELMEKLSQFGIQSMDQGNFYRVLRQLEKDELVTSIWDTSSGGPAKRIYSITDGGEKYLEVWADSLGHYQKMLNQFFNLYNPFYNPFMVPTKETEDKDKQD